MMQKRVIEVLRGLRPIGSSFAALFLGSRGIAPDMYAALEKHLSQYSSACRSDPGTGAVHSEVGIGDGPNGPCVVAIVVRTAEIVTNSDCVALSQGAQDFSMARERYSERPGASDGSPRFFIVVERADEPQDVMAPAAWTARAIEFW